MGIYLGAERLAQDSAGQVVGANIAGAGTRWWDGGLAGGDKRTAGQTPQATGANPAELRCLKLATMTPAHAKLALRLGARTARWRYRTGGAPIGDILPCRTPRRAPPFRTISVGGVALNGTNS